MVKTRITNNYGDMKKKVIKKFHKRMKSTLKKAIIDENILKGKSPVAGKGKFKKYSESYKKAIKAGRYGNKSVTPVNLKVTGSMLKSFYVELASSGVKIGFDSKIADYHNRQGAGKSKVIRQMLPTSSKERFNKNVRDIIKEELKSIFDGIFKK